MIAVKNGESLVLGGKDAWDHVFLCHQIAEINDVGGKEQGTAAWDRNEALFYYCLTSTTMISEKQPVLNGTAQPEIPDVTMNVVLPLVSVP